MSFDAELRALERVLDSHEHPARDPLRLVQRLRRGDLSEAKLKLAARLGHAQALAVVTGLGRDPATLPAEAIALNARLSEALMSLGGESAAPVLCFLSAERVINELCSERPDSPERIRLELARRHLRGDLSQDGLQDALEDAEKALLVIDFGRYKAGVSSLRVDNAKSAINGLCKVLALGWEPDNDLSDLCYFAACASHDVQAELRWQLQRLAEHVLGEAPLRVK